MQKVWNYDYFGDMRTVDVTVRRLREKIEADPRQAAVYFNQAAARAITLRRKRPKTRI